MKLPALLAEEDSRSLDRFCTRHHHRSSVIPQVSTGNAYAVAPPIMKSQLTAERLPDFVRNLKRKHMVRTFLRRQTQNHRDKGRQIEIHLCLSGQLLTGRQCPSGKSVKRTDKG